MRPSRRNRLTLTIAGGLTAGILLAAALLGVGTAKADLTPDQNAYVSTYGEAVCHILDEYPSLAGVTGTALAIMEDGFTAEAAGEIIGTSAIVFCPRHIPMLLALADNYQSTARTKLEYT